MKLSIDKLIILVAIFCLLLSWSMNGKSQTDTPGDITNAEAILKDNFS
jgi:hypothetical protein